MKGYKFKLEALLKLRKLKEETCKMEIGRLQVHLNKLKEQVDEHNRGIDEAYTSQEVSLESGVDGQEVRFYPFFVEGKRAHIEQTEAEIQQYQHHIDRKYQELAVLRGNVKVLEDMKDKQKTAYKKKLNKKIEETIEEQVQNWRLAGE